MQRGLVLTSIPQSERLVRSVLWGRWGLGTEAQASEVRLWGEDWGWLCENSLRGLGCGAPQLRESGKKSGPTREARCHCWEAPKEMDGPTTGASFSWHLRWQGTAYMSSRGGREPLFPSWTLEAGSDCCCCCRGSCEQVQVTAPTFPGACAVCHYRGFWDPVPTTASSSPGACDPPQPLQRDL